MLLLARTEAGQEPASDRLHLDEIVFDTVELLQSLADAKGIHLHLELPDDPVTVRGNRTSLGLLVRNLIENAIKFTETGTVRVAVTAQEDRALVIVEDSGPGIPEQALPHIFERFYQSDGRHRQSGSGLGLALVQSVAR